MFDDVKNEPEDVFAETDASAPQMTPPSMSAAPSPAPAAAPVMASAPLSAAPEYSTETAVKRPFPWKLGVLFVAIIAVIGLAFFLSMKILNSRTAVTPEAPSETQNTEEIQPIEQIPAVVPVTEVPPVVEPEADSDRDGLSDVRETQLGTDPNNPDTDGDGLFDKEEVDVYKTNPLNGDTDGDTFSDGSEVKNGYNPSGPGKILQIPQK